ncbi:MAG: DNA/RNA non-specific endonuclease [Nitrososphaera sp.]|nr:DNA/RNA non-specific endonuclease [Nitrososphaera sp.]
MYYRARWYDPLQGKFISEDPIGYTGGANLYSYVGNNPLNLADPSGLYGTLLSQQRVRRYSYPTLSELNPFFGPGPFDPLGVKSDVTIGVMVYSPVETGTSASGSPASPLSRLYPLGDYQAGDERGHIIGKQLGGSGDPEHLFYQARSLNRGAYKVFENRIRNHIDNSRCDVCVLAVVLTYNDKSKPFRASDIDYYVVCKSGVTFNEHFINK